MFLNVLIVVNFVVIGTAIKKAKRKNLIGQYKQNIRVANILFVIWRAFVQNLTTSPIHKALVTRLKDNTENEM